MSFLEIINELKESLFGYNSFFYARNLIEVIFFTVIIYYFSLWLKQDKKNNLLLYFYGYCTISLIAYYGQLPTISYLMFLFSPVAIMLFITFHQKTLQKNFVTLNNNLQSFTNNTAQKKDWPQEIIRSFLCAINNNKRIFCVIEKNNNLQDFIDSQIYINCNIDHELLNILHSSSTFDQNKIIWLNAKGQIIAINAFFNNSFLNNSISEETTDKNLTNNYISNPTLAFKQKASILSSKTDAILLFITPEQRSFNIIFNGEVFNNINSDNVINIIKKHAISSLKDQKNFNNSSLNKHGRETL